MVISAIYKKNYPIHL